MRKTLILFLILSGIILHGCRTGRQVVMPGTTEWDKAVIPFKLHIDGNISLSGKAYFTRGKSIYISVRYIGMEVMSVYADNDSAYLYDKTNGILVCEPLGRNPLTGKRLDANQLQDLLLCATGNGSQIELSSDILEIKFSPIDLLGQLDNNLISSWTAKVINTRTLQDLNASLVWNFNGADWTAYDIPVWKRPLKPKRSLSLNDMLLVLSSQF